MLSSTGKVYTCGRNCKGQLGLGNVANFPSNERGHEYTSTFRRVRLENDSNASTENKETEDHLGKPKNEDHDHQEHQEHQEQKQYTEQSERREGEEQEYDNDEIILDVACGGEHTCILTESGKVYTFGQASSGQLGHYVFDANDTIPTVNHPKIVEGLGRAKGLSVACGNACTLVLMKRPEPPSLADICMSVLNENENEKPKFSYDSEIGEIVQVEHTGRK